MSTNVVLPRSIATTVTAGGALAPGKHARVDATAGPLTMTLPAATTGNAGATLSVEKTDSSSNAITISGSIRGASSSVTLTWQSESIEFLADAAGSWYPTAGHKTKTSLDTAYGPKVTRRIRPALPGISVGSTTTTPNSAGAFATAGVTVRSPYKAVFSVTNIQVKFPNWYWSTGPKAETTNANDLPVKAALEYNGTTYPLFFGGTRNPTINAGGESMWSDPLGITIPAGAEYYIRSFTVAGSGTVIQGPAAGGPGITATGSFTNGSDACDATGALSQSPAQYGGLVPLEIVGTPTDGSTPSSLLAIGDSILVGVNDLPASGTGSGPTTGWGWFVRWVNNAVPAHRIAAFGDGLQKVLTPGAALKRFPILSSYSHVLVELGVNDYTTPRTFSQMQADATSLVQMLQGLGLKVSYSTITPVTTSTDSWATTGNQTKNTNDAARTAFNDWLRTVPLGLVGVLEVADQVETSRNSGIWKANYTADGTHPNTAAHTAISTALPAVLTIMP